MPAREQQLPGLKATDLVRAKRYRRIAQLTPHDVLYEWNSLRQTFHHKLAEILANSRSLREKHMTWITNTPHQQGRKALESDAVSQMTVWNQDDWTVEKSTDYLQGRAQRSHR